MRRVYHNARLILPPHLRSGEGFLSEEDGHIRSVQLREGKSDFEDLLSLEKQLCEEEIDCQGDYLSPGLIDLHCHGALGRDTMEATQEAFDVILNYHATRGTTLAVLTTVAASLSEIEGVLSGAEKYQKERKNPLFAGIHLEGPYFSPLRQGAHRQAMLRHPSPEETEVLLKYAGVISRITLAPEIPGVIELIPILKLHGIVVSAGHSEAIHDEALAGFSAGITQVTHLYNCMSSLHSKKGRRSTGLAEAALTMPGVLCEVIADGRHLSPTLLRLAWLAKGWQEIAIVSDATAGSGLPEGASFQLGGLPCRIEQGEALTGVGEDQRLAGSTIGMIDGVRGMVEGGKTPPEEAVAMASLVPARALNLEHSRGSLEVGKRSDLIRFTEDWQVRGVWSAGEKIV
ncbi:MAG: N-acetylglucosamine-6-phosphate deacetylase [bacterium]